MGLEGRLNRLERALAGEEPVVVRFPDGSQQSFREEPLDEIARVWATGEESPMLEAPSC